MNLPSFLRFATLILLATLLAACSSFDSHWDKQSSTRATRWDGQWTSAKHHTTQGAPEGGRLRCVLEPLPKGRLAAYFHANWKIFAGNFDVVLQPAKGGPRQTRSRAYEGSHDLPAIFGGTYHYKAIIDDRHFLAHYTSSYDHGAFTLRRVPGAKDSSNANAGH